MNRAILFASCFLAVIADMMLVMWSKNSKHQWWFLASAFLINAAGVFIWCCSMRKGIESATAITIYAVFTVAGCSLLGHYAYNEHLSEINIIGVLLGIVSLILVSL